LKEWLRAKKSSLTMTKGSQFVQRARRGMKQFERKVLEEFNYY
jgi:hypothetical protein